MNARAENPFPPEHPLGALASLAARAEEWRTRERGLGSTWAGLWHPSQEAEILAVVAQQALRVDDGMLKRLSRQGALPGVRDYALLWAILPAGSVPAPGDIDCVDSTTEAGEAFSGRGAGVADQEGAADEDEDVAIVGVPIWYHSELEQARLTSVRHAIHVVRHLEDYHEPTVGAQRRQRLRRLGGKPPEERLAACEEIAETFLAQPTCWRDVVEVAVYLAAVRECEGALGLRISGPGRSIEQLQVKLDGGLIGLMLGGATAIAGGISTRFRTRLARLREARVVLLYEEHQYLQLAGVQGGRSIRRHLKRGLHLVFSDQQHRRADRTAGLWLEQSDEAQRAGFYHFAEAVPPAYAAARKQRDYFRLSGAEALRRYVMSDLSDDIV